MQNLNSVNNSITKIQTKSNLSRDNLPELLSSVVCSRCNQPISISLFNGVTKSKTWCNNCDRTWQTHKIIPNKTYSLSEIIRTIGGSWRTLARWRKSGRLVVINNRQSCTSGEWLLSAIYNKSNFGYKA